MVEIEIDGKKVEVPEGSMVMHAADKAGTYIPHFCYHKKLSIAANCRMCLVDIEMLDNVAENIQGRTICALGDAAAMPVRAFIKHYRDEFVHHIEHKTCVVPAYV